MGNLNYLLDTEPDKKTNLNHLLDDESTSSIPEVSLTATGDIKPVGSPDPIPYSVTATDKKELSFGKKITTPTLEALVGVTKKNFEENPIFKDRKNRDIYFNALSKKYDPGTIESLRSFTEREYEAPWLLKMAMSPYDMAVEGVPAGIEKVSKNAPKITEGLGKLMLGQGDPVENATGVAKATVGAAAGVAETGMSAAAVIPEVQPIIMGFHAIQGTPAEWAIMPASKGIQYYYEQKGIQAPEWTTDLGVLVDLAWGGMLGFGAKKLIGKGSVKPQDITDALNDAFKDPKDLNAIVESGGDPVVANIIKQKSDLTEALANPEISDQVKSDFIMPAIEAANQNIVVELGTKTGTNTAEAATVATLEHLKDQQSKMPEGVRGALQPAIDELQVKVESFNPAEVKNYDALKTESEQILAKENIGAKDLMRLSELDEKIAVTDAFIEQEIGKVNPELSAKISEVKGRITKANEVIDNGGSGIELQKASEEIANGNKELLDLLKEKNNLRNEIKNATPESNQPIAHESKSPEIPGTPITEDVPTNPIIEPDIKPKVEGVSEDVASEPKPTATPPGEEGGIKSTPNGKENDQKGRKKGLLNETTPESQGAVTPLSEPKPDTSLKSDPSPPKTSLELAKEKLKAAKERAAKLRDNTNLGTTIDPFEKTKQQAIADREVLDGYIGVAKEYIKEGIKTVEEFAKAIGEKIDDVKKAWDFAEKGEVYGIKVDMLDDAVKDALHDKGDRRKFDEVETEARRKVAVGEIRPEEMINKINSGEKYLPNGEDIIALIDHKVNLEKQRTEIKQRFDEAQDQGVKNKIQGELDIVTDKLFQWDEMAIRTAADQSQAFRFRQLMRDNEFNAVKAIRDWKAEDKNGTIPAEMEAKIKEWAEKFRVLNDELAKRDQELTLEKEGRAEDNMKAEAEREKMKEALEAKKNPEKSKSTLSPEKLARKKELWKDIYGQANDVFHVIAKMATKDGIEFLSLVFEEAAGDFKKFSKEIIKGAGKEIAPYLKKLYKDAGGTDEGIYGASKPFLNKKGDLEVPHSLIRALVESGVEKIEDITKAVHAMVKDEFPGITETKVRDTITKYGLTRNPNPDVIERKISLAKRIGRKLSSVERLKKLKAPLKSGLIPVDITPIERQLNREIRNMQKLLPKTQEEITKVWKTAVERTKTRLEHQIEDLKIAIDTATKMVKADGKATPDTKEINDLRDRKAELQKVYDEKFGKNAHELTDAERVERAINALEKESKNIAKDIKNGEIAYNKTKLLPVNEALKKARERNKLIKEVLADLRKEEGLASAKEMEMRKDANIRYVLKQRERINNKEFDPKPKKAFAKDEELLNILVQRRKVKQEWETAREKHRMEQRTLAEQWYETWRDIWGGTKSAITSLDVSAGGRQGLPLSIANPAMAKKAMKIQFEHMFSQEASDRWLAELQNKPIYQLMKDAKLYISEPTSKLLAKEEAFASNFAEKIPWVKPSERAYVGYLNSIRTDVFEKMVSVLEDQGKTWEKNPQAFKDAAKFINDLTGRGPINENAAKVLSDPIIGMFSPRYVASRFSFFNPKNYLNPKIDPVVRQERIKSTVKFMGTVAAVLALAKYSGMADVSLDPTDTDFLKIKIGNKRIDILAGYSQTFGFMAKMVAEAYKQIKYLQTGVKPEGGDNEDGLLKTAAHFYRGKATPVGSAAADLYMGEDIIGDKSTIAGEAAGLVTPLVVRDIYDLYKKEGAGWAAGLSIPLLFGIPTTSYGTTDKIWEVSAMSPEGNKVNVLGDQIDPNVYESNKGKEISDVWKFLDKYGGRPTFPKKSDLNLKDENGKNRAPTNEESYNYIVRSGEFIKEELRDLMDNGRKDDNSEYTDEETGETKYTYTDISLLTPEEQKSEIKKAITRGKERAKKDLFED
jgi:hypothetical protein